MIDTKMIDVEMIDAETIDIVITDKIDKYLITNSGNTILIDEPYYGKIFNERTSYQGYFVNNEYHGYGRLKFLNHAEYDLYIGNFQNNKFNGDGILLYKTGAYFKGSFINDLKHGYGSMYNLMGCILYNGEWADDKIYTPVYFEERINNKVTIKGYKKNDLLHGLIYYYDKNNNYEKIHLYSENTLIKEIILQPNFKIKYMYNNVNISSIRKNIDDIINSKNIIDNKNIIDYMYNILDNTDILEFTPDNKIISYSSNTPEICYEYYDNCTYIGKKDTRKIGSGNFINCIQYKGPINSFTDFKNELIAEGSFKNYMLNGKGTFYPCKNQLQVLNLSDRVFSGIFYDGCKLDGFCKINNVKIYEGIFDISGDLKLLYILNGNGIEYYDGILIKYKGSFYNNQYDGEGTEYYDGLNIKYQGSFINNKYDGEGCSFYLNNNIEYHGMWKNNLKNGNGILYSENGEEIYSGLFANDNIIDYNDESKLTH